MKKAYLQEAFAWICESCGKMNYSHTVMQHLTEEEFEQMFDVEVTEATDTRIEHPPTIVVCSLCRESFETEMDDD